MNWLMFSVGVDHVSQAMGVYGIIPGLSANATVSFIFGLVINNFRRGQNHVRLTHLRKGQEIFFLLNAE